MKATVNIPIPPLEQALHVLPSLRPRAHSRATLSRGVDFGSSCSLSSHHHGEAASVTNPLVQQCLSFTHQEPQANVVIFNPSSRY